MANECDADEDYTWCCTYCLVFLLDARKSLHLDTPHYQASDEVVGITGASGAISNDKPRPVDGYRKSLALHPAHHGFCGPLALSISQIVSQSLQMRLQ